MATFRRESIASQLFYALLGRDDFSPGPGPQVIEKASSQVELDRRDYDNRVLARKVSKLEEEIKGWKQTYIALERVAMLEPLTGLFNRRGGEYEFERALASYRRHEHNCDPATLLWADVSVIVVDIDKFKQINDVYGHDAGDRVLVAIAKHLGRELRADDIVIRWGGDEFVVYAIGATQDAILKRAQDLVKALAADEELKMAGHHATCSIGIAHGKFRTERGAWGLIGLLRRAADEAMYEAKQAVGPGSCIATAPDSITVE
ncbi:MAG: GGDEF domain-containing protein [Candidatus Moraniibacteriota bacterium]|nr:MAG: GGDEF domain-containing protein [Candidatus Moranbacteria bacterium]